MVNPCCGRARILMVTLVHESRFQGRQTWICAPARCSALVSSQHVADPAGKAGRILHEPAVVTRKRDSRCAEPLGQRIGRASRQLTPRCLADGDDDPRRA